MKLLSFIGANGPTWGAVVGQDDVIDLGKEMPQHANLAAYIGSGDYLKAQDHVVGKNQGKGDFRPAGITTGI